MAEQVIETAVQAEGLQEIVADRLSQQRSVADGEGVGLAQLRLRARAWNAANVGSRFQAAPSRITSTREEESVCGSVVCKTRITSF
jgi:hypothetical protein